MMKVNYRLKVNYITFFVIKKVLEKITAYKR